MPTNHNNNDDDFIPTRKSLIDRLRNWDDSRSWEEFFNTYGKFIYRVARKADLNDAEAQDVVQETIVVVAKKMPGFRYDPAIGSFKNWLMLITRRRIVDQFRKKNYINEGKMLPRADALDPQVLEHHQAAAFTPDSIWLEEWRQSLFEAALEKLRAEVSPIQFQVFQLHGLKNRPAREVADRLGVKLMDVYLAKYKLTGLIKKKVKELEKMNF